MYYKLSAPRRFFILFNYVLLIGTAVLCLLPMINVLAVSFSNSNAAAANEVAFWPVGFNLNSYEYIIAKKEFITSFIVSLKRTLTGVPFNLLITLLVAYPLSKDDRKFTLRKYFVWFFMITMLFNGGLNPFYMMIRFTGLLDSLWALILPGGVSVFSIVVLLNFFRELPKEIEEAAYIDGAGHWRTLWLIYFPLSLPALATLTLLNAVGHWNSWFDGLILMNDMKNYPLQSYLQTVIIRFDTELFSRLTTEEAQMLGEISNRTTKASQIFIAALPILIIYPFLQRFFMTGLVLGSVKG